MPRAISGPLQGQVVPLVLTVGGRLEGSWEGLYVKGESTKSSTLPSCVYISQGAQWMDLWAVTGLG